MSLFDNDDISFFMKQNFKFPKLKSESWVLNMSSEYTKKNLEDNVTIFSQKNNAVLKENFFSQSNEVIFRSLTEVIKIVGKKYYAVRGKKIDKVINLISTKSSFKVTDTDIGE